VIRRLSHVPHRRHFGRGYFAIAHGMSIVIPSPIGARDKRFIENY
jgi:hypothetical protein